MRSHDPEIMARSGGSYKFPGRIKGWLKKRLSRPQGRSNVSVPSREGTTGNISSSRRDTWESGSIGCVGPERSIQRLEGRCSSKRVGLRDIAPAGRQEDHHHFFRDGENEVPMTLSRDVMLRQPVSPRSSTTTSSEDHDEFMSMGRNSDDDGAEVMAPSPAKPSGHTASGVSLPRDSRFQEII